MADEVLELAYESGRTALQQQDTTLANLRNRATALLAATAVGTSLSTGVGLLNTDPSKGATLPGWAGFPLLGTLLVIGIAVLAIAWPTPWSFGLRAELLAERAGRDIDDVRRAAVKAMVVATRANSAVLARRMLWFRIATAMLVAQLLFLTTTLVLTGG